MTIVGWNKPHDLVKLAAKHASDRSGPPRTLEEEAHQCTVSAFRHWSETRLVFRCDGDFVDAVADPPPSISDRLDVMALPGQPYAIERRRKVAGRMAILWWDGHTLNTTYSGYGTTHTVGRWEADGFVFCESLSSVEECRRLTWSGYDVDADAYEKVRAEVLRDVACMLCIEGWRRTGTGDLRQKRARKSKGKKRRLSVTEVAVGYRIGAALRARPTLWRPSSNAEGGSRRSPVGHMRRGHWRRQWIGPQQERRCVMRWIPPVAVNLEAGEALHPAVRAVQP